MAEVNLLRSLPRAKRNISQRGNAKTPEVIAAAREYGELYFDGPRDYGYGGYRYDGRWLPVAKDIIAHFGLKPGMRVLDVGCAKGFLVKDFMLAEPRLEAFGLDISEYALKHCEEEVVGRLHLGSADRLPFPDKSFDCVLSINTIHNFDRDGRADRLARNRARVAGPLFRAGQLLSHARAERALRGVGAHGALPRLPARLARCVCGSRLLGRPLLDDRRMNGRP